MITNGMDWSAALLPQTPLLELLVRGTIMYLGLFFMLRFIVKREAGSLGVTDMLVIVLIADAAQNGMADDYRSVSDGLVLVLTILLWSYLLDVLAFRFPILRRVLRPPRIQLVERGQIVRRNLEREKITEEELMGELRAHGVDALETVRAAYIESDGMISVITPRIGRADRPQKRDGRQET